MKGGKREGSGRKSFPHKRISLAVEVIEKLQEVPGKNWNERILYLLKSGGR